MDWTGGYASDIEYTAGYYREQCPELLNMACMMNGFEPVPLDQPYTYFELGFGRGLTVNLLAAANPMGQFYGADFNPAHVADARQLAAEAGLDNITLLENSFDELAGGQVALPQFDFITLHGIYTWVTAENRQHIVSFINRYLKPGGIVYVSYNAMPGWSAALPLQRLLVEHGDMFPGRSDVQIKGAREFVDKLATLGASYFTKNPGLDVRMNLIKTGDPHYLVHEYMHRHWQPLYHADVARDLALAKLDFAGSAELPFAFPNIYLSTARQALLAEVTDAPMRETLKDYCLNTAFRKDVFVRGARAMSGTRKGAWMSRVSLALTVPRAQAVCKFKLIFGDVEVKPDLYEPLFDALAIRPHSLPELATLPALKGQSASNITQMVALLAGSGQALPFLAKPVNVAPALRMNRALAMRASYNDEYQALASSMLGGAIPASQIELLVYAALSAPEPLRDPEPITQFTWNLMRQQGRCMLADGKPIQDSEGNLAALRIQVALILERKVPLWHQLGML